MECRNKEDSINEKPWPDHTASSKAWGTTIDEQISELHLIASWASMCKYSSVESHCRLAIAELTAIKGGLK